MLGSRIALLTGFPDTAVNLLAPLSEPDARLLRLWARSKNQSMTAEQILSNGKRLLEQEEFQSLKAPVLSIMATAAAASGNRIQQADLIERYLLDPTRISGVNKTDALTKSLPDSTPLDLFRVYSAIAKEQANKVGLLVGEESSWGTFANAIPSEQSLVRRAVWAYIASVTDNISRQIAADNLVNAAVDSERMDLVQNPIWRLKPVR